MHSTTHNTKRTPYHFLKKSDKGFTLLIAILVSGVLLAIGLSIFNIASKELILSSAGRESQFAFYAADSGVECTLFEDRVNSAFTLGSPVASVTCGGVAVPVVRADAPPTAISQFSFYLNGAGTGQCATVRVAKTTVGPFTSTQVDSRGYNTCDPANPRRVERGIRTFY